MPTEETALAMGDMEVLLDTCIDTHFTKIINNLQETWQSYNKKGDTIAKRMLTISTWGAYRDDQSIITF